MRSVIWIAALLSGAISLESGLFAATTIKYLEFPAGTLQGDNLNLPLILNLPCDGKVRVTISPTPPPSTTFWQQTGAQGGSVTQNQTVYSWGTDTNRFNVISNGTIDYTITFTFDTPPDASRLFLVVAGLAAGTTATVSTAPVSPAGSLVGEFPIGGTSTTAITGSVLSHSQGTGDPVNTGWALYQPKSSATFTALSVAMHQIGGDGVGWTLGYICEATPPCGPENSSRCCQKPGACCIKETCVQISASECKTLGGEFFGEATSCKVGACKVPGVCVVIPESECQKLQGTYQGDNSKC